MKYQVASSRIFDSSVITIMHGTINTRLFILCGSYVSSIIYISSSRIVKRFPKSFHTKLLDQFFHLHNHNVLSVVIRRTVIMFLVFTLHYLNNQVF